MAPPLGFKGASVEYKEKIKDYIKQSDMPVYMDSKYHFYEVATELAKFSYHPEIDKSSHTKNVFKKIKERRDKKWPTLRATRS
jgi:hypothetical protein